MPPQINDSPEAAIKAKEDMIKKLQAEVAKEKAVINKEKDRQAKKEKAKALLQRYS